MIFFMKNVRYFSTPSSFCDWSKSLWFALFLSIFFLKNVYAQVQIDIGGSETSLMTDITINTTDIGTCKTLEFDGTDVENNSSLNLNYAISAGVGDPLLELIKMKVNGEVFNPISTVFTPTYTCHSHLLNVRGGITNYTIYFNTDLIYSNIVSGDIDYVDVLEIYAPEATEIELTFGVSATLVAVQSFCDPGGSQAIAAVMVQGTLGGQSVCIDEAAGVKGAFISSKHPEKKDRIRLAIPAGLSLFPMHITGYLYVESTVLGLGGVGGAEGLIACASSVVAGTGSSFFVEHFTGVDGSPLLEGMTIHGLNTGVNYVNPIEGVPCSGDIPTALIETTLVECGSEDGTATVTNVIDSLGYSWSNGVEGTEVSDLAYGIYTLEVSNDECSRNFPFTIEDPFRPNITLPEQTSIEEGDTATLYATDLSDTTLTYLWSTGDTTATIEVHSAGTYAVTITTVEECEYSVSSEVSVMPVFLEEACIVADYPFNGNANDASTFANHGTVHGATLVPDRFGKPKSAYYFDGVNDYISLTQTANTQPTELGISCWFKTIATSIGGDVAGYIIRDRHYSYALGFNSLAPGDVWGGLSTEDGGYRSYISDETTYNDDNWHFLAMTYHPDGLLKFYIDGTLIAEKNYPPSDIKYAIGGGLSIGRDGSHNSNYVKGFIDDVKIFSCAFDQQFVTNAYEEDLQCAIQIDSVTVTCLPDGYYSVSVPLVSYDDSVSYTIYEQNNYFEEIDTVYIEIADSAQTIDMGPYPVGREYNIMIEGKANDFVYCDSKVSGLSDCEISCDLVLELTFECDSMSGQTHVFGTIQNGTSPFSVTSEVLNTVLMPNDGRDFELVIDGSEQPELAFQVLDFNYCLLNDTVQVPECYILNTETAPFSSSCLKNLEAYPNPTTTSLFFKKNGACPFLTLSIIDVYGNTVFLQKQTDFLDSIDISSLPAGMYFIHFQNGDEKKVQKMVKW